MDWLFYMYPFAWKLVYAVPNGGYRHPGEALNLKREGVKPGVPDIHVAIPTEKYPGLYLEFKFGRNKVTPGQQAFIENLRLVGYRVEVVYDFEEAHDVFLDYMKGSPFLK
jgi:hypothetical protein